jgi:hypothetical protein
MAVKIFVCNRPPNPVRLTGGELEKCRGRPLPEIFHLFADTACRKLRAAGNVGDCASPRRSKTSRMPAASAPLLARRPAAAISPDSASHAGGTQSNGQALFRMKSTCCPPCPSPGRPAAAPPDCGRGRRFENRSFVLRALRFPNLMKYLVFICLNVSFKDTLSCRSSIYFRCRPHRP